MLVQGGKTVGANDDSDIPQHGSQWIQKFGLISLHRLHALQN